MFEINHLFESCALQRYYDESGKPSYYTLSDLLGKLRNGAVPKKMLAADPHLRPATLEAALLAHRGGQDQFDAWLVKQLETPRHDLKILLDTNIPETFYPYIEDRFGSFDLAPKGVSKRADAWENQSDYDLVIIRNIGTANRPSPQFVKAADPEQDTINEDKTPVVVLCSHTAQEEELAALFDRLNQIIHDGYLERGYSEIRLNTAGCVAFRQGQQEPDVDFFPKKSAAPHTNHGNVRQPA